MISVAMCTYNGEKFIEDQLPQDHIKISFEEGIDENRTVILEYTGPVSKSIVEAYHD